MGPQHLQARGRVPADRHGEARRSPHLRSDGDHATVYGPTGPDGPDTKPAVAHVDQGDAAFSVWPILRETDVLRGASGGGHVPGEPSRRRRAGEGDGGSVLRD